MSQDYPFDRTCIQSKSEILSKSIVTHFITTQVEENGPVQTVKQAENTLIPIVYGPYGSVFFDLGKQDLLISTEKVVYE